MSWLSTEEQESDSDRRLAEAILYVAQRLQEMEHRSRGAVKLNKILWRADFEAFRRLGGAVTGAEYQRLPEGPAPVRLVPIRAQLERDAHAHIEARDVGAPRPETVLVNDRDPDLTLFSEEERAALDEAIEYFEGKTGRQCSEISHRESAGWQAVNDGEIIPYETGLIDPSPIEFDAETKERVELLISAHRASLDSSA